MNLLILPEKISNLSLYNADNIKKKKSKGPHVESTAT